MWREVDGPILVHVHAGGFLVFAWATRAVRVYALATQACFRSCIARGPRGPHACLISVYLSRVLAGSELASTSPPGQVTQADNHLRKFYRMGHAGRTVCFMFDILHLLPRHVCATCSIRLHCIALVPQ